MKGNIIRHLVILFLLFCCITAIIINKDRNAAVTTGAVEARAVPTLVIDPGHGGMDGGAVSAEGQRESEINLAIALKMNDLLHLFGICPIMTRTDEALEYPESAVTTREKKVWDQKRRVELVNSCAPAILISIHQNQYPDIRPSGVQVFYGREGGSEALGVLLHENLQSAFCPSSRRVAAPISDSIYLMKHVTCPAVLVECGFLSNPEEAKKLADNGYQTALAAVLCASCLQYIG